MNILTFFTPAELSTVNFDSELTVIIDVLRGSTTLATAFFNGAVQIIPVGDTKHAFKLAKENDNDNIVLCGSINGEIIDGFDLGNSPLEYKPEIVQGKRLIYCSINLSRALAVARHQSRVMLGCFNNLHSIVNGLGEISTLLILCAGKNGRFSIEDTVCAGMFIQYILNKLETDFSLNDASSTARYLFYRHHRDIAGMLQQSSHGIYLGKLGYAQDIDYAAMLNTTEFIPELSLEKSYLIPTVPTGSSVQIG